MPEGAFEVLVRQQIARLLDPSIDCAYEIYEELRKIIISIQIPELQRFYRLHTKIIDEMEMVLDKCLTPTTEMIANIIEIENEFINKNHPDFVGSSDSLLNLFQTQEEFKQNKQPTYTLSHMPEKPSKQKGNVLLDTSNQQEMEVIEEDDLDKGSMFGSIAGFLGKTSKKQPEIEESKIYASDIDSEQMVKKAQTRNIKEEKLMIERNITKKTLREQTDLALMNKRFDVVKDRLPPIILPPIEPLMRAGDNQSARIIMETRVIQNLIQSYFDLTKTNIADLIPKTIMAFLVHQSRSIAQSELIEKIYKNGNLEQLIVEDPMIAAQRESLTKTIKALKHAQTLLSEVTTFKY